MNSADKILSIPYQTPPTEKRSLGGQRMVSILGIPFQRINQHDSILAIERFIQERIPRQICMSNAYTVALAQSDSVLRSLLKQAVMVLPDGMSIVWGGRWVSAPLPERIAGPDLMEALCRRASKNGYRVFLLGSDERTLHQLKEKLQRLCPELIFSGTYNPPVCDRFGEEENTKILKNLHETRPDILFVGLSCPKQEKWIAENLDRTGVPVVIGVGAAFDFLSGNIPRAPHWMRDSGFEWLYRLYREPRRLWKRYLLGNFIFLSLLLKESLLNRLSVKTRLVGDKSIL